MEQYWMPRKLDFKNLRMCLDLYPQDFLYIRLVGSRGGTVKVNTSLEGRSLDFKKNKSGLHLFVDKDEVFHFPLKNYEQNKGFSLAYERIRPTEDGIGSMVILSTGEDPYDMTLPEPRRSYLRHVLDDHLLEIFFTGRVDLKFHSWWEKPYWKYWTVDKPGSVAEAIAKSHAEHSEENS